jgi:TPP-dependent pyruvate/acetoin dehydrogenase alpha subunit
LKLLKEISELKTLLITQKNLNDKTINTVEKKCKKMVKEAIEDHDKSIKDAIDKTFNTFKADLKSNIHTDIDVNDANTNLSQKNSKNLKKAKLSM